MTKRYSRFILVLLTFISLWWVSCSTERDICLEPKIVTVHLGCYRIADDNITVIDTLLPNANLLAIKNDSLFGWVVGAKGYNKFSLPLSPKADSCAWIIQPDSSVFAIDTLVFHYKNSVHFLSTACGYTYFYNLDSVSTTKHNIDSVIISSTGITNNANIEHVKVYFHKS